MSVLTKHSIQDIFEWDVVNWSRALNVWGPYLEQMQGKQVLAAGEMNGGLSLLCSLFGAQVTCTDIEEPREAARQLHQRYGISEHITYDRADITALPYPDASYDFVLFKSLLVALQTYEQQRKGIEEALRVLRPGGMLLFIENLRGSDLHMLFRGMASTRPKRYRYIPISDIPQLLAGCTREREATWGVTGLLRLHPALQAALGHSDRITEKIVPAAWHYLYAAACKKPGTTNG